MLYICIVKQSHKQQKQNTMKTIKNQNFERVTSDKYNVYYWEPIVVCNEKKEKESFSLILRKMYIGGNIGYYLYLQFGGQEYSAEIAKIRISGERTIDEVEKFFKKVVSLYQSERKLRKTSEYIRMANN